MNKKDEEIPDFKDKTWGEAKELGTITEVIEYLDGGVHKKVKVTAHTLSGESIMALEAEHTSVDPKTKEEKMDADGYIMAMLCRVFDAEEKYLKTIFSNKSSDLRNKLIGFMNRTCGFDLKANDNDKEKNSESPQS